MPALWHNPIPTTACKSHWSQNELLLNLDKEARNKHESQKLILQCYLSKWPVNGSGKHPVDITLLRTHSCNLAHTQMRNHAVVTNSSLAFNLQCPQLCLVILNTQVKMTMSTTGKCMSITMQPGFYLDLTVIFLIILLSHQHRYLMPSYPALEGRH